MKLVNSDKFDKKMNVKLDNLNVAKNAEWIVLTGKDEYVHSSNINTKEEELVKPVLKNIEINNNFIEIDLPANSVSVIVLSK